MNPDYISNVFVKSHVSPIFRFFNNGLVIRTIYLSLEDNVVYANTANIDGTDSHKNFEYKLDLPTDVTLAESWNNILEEFIYHWKPKDQRVSLNLNKKYGTV